MSRIPSPLTAAEHGMTPVTVWLSPELVARLERIIDTAIATHPEAEPERVTDLVMAAGIEAVERNAPPSTAACISEKHRHSRASGGSVTPAAEACGETSDLHAPTGAGSAAGKAV